jgi:hypothetical protein
MKGTEVILMLDMLVDMAEKAKKNERSYNEILTGAWLVTQSFYRQPRGSD